jgi:hypothetical protein
VYRNNNCCCQKVGHGTGTAYLVRTTADDRVSAQGQKVMSRAGSIVTVHTMQQGLKSTATRGLPRRPQIAGHLRQSLLLYLLYKRWDDALPPRPGLQPTRCGSVGYRTWNVCSSTFWFSSPPSRATRCVCLNRKFLDRERRLREEKTRASGTTTRLTKTRWND